VERVLGKFFANEQDGIEDANLNHQLTEQAVNLQILVRDLLGGAVTMQKLDFFFNTCYP